MSATPAPGSRVVVVIVIDQCHRIHVGVRAADMKLGLSANAVLPNFSRVKPTSNMPLSVQSNHHRRPHAVAVYSCHISRNAYLTPDVVCQVGMMAAPGPMLTTGGNPCWPAWTAGYTAGNLDPLLLEPLFPPTYPPCPLAGCIPDGQHVTESRPRSLAPSCIRQSLCARVHRCPPAGYHLQVAVFHHVGNKIDLPK
ncbi:hypothetical protein BR93DRAFT_725355 [Coniochaeta sp. PMI_546]|nr:hypothetical protein BR93DRAFT_725355 [Coniochaeta sp. PMI_546]